MKSEHAVLNAGLLSRPDELGNEQGVMQESMVAIAEGQEHGPLSASMIASGG